MRVIIAGSRTIREYELVKKIIEESGFSISLVVCGMAKGVDEDGARWADENKIPIAWYPANWNKYGKSAGARRNQDMANNADALILIWDGQSKGSKNMLIDAVAKKLQVFECIVLPNGENYIRRY